MEHLKWSIKKINAFLRWGDLFSTTQFLRFRGNNDYGTATGGCVTLTVIIVFTILFASIGIQTINRQIIHSSVSVESQTDPAPLQIVMGPSGGFTFLVGVLGINLNDPLVSYFDVKLTQNYYHTLLNPINSTEVPLEQCTLQHLAFTNELTQFFKKFTISWALCPPINSVLNVGGTASSNIFSTFTVSISKCNSTINPKCIDDHSLAAIQKKRGYFTTGLSFVSAIINPGDQNYVQFSIDDRNPFYFTIDSQAVKVNGQIAQTQVDTDVSIMPYSDAQAEYFIGLADRLTSQQIPIVNGLYAEFSFTKAGRYPVYTRSFNKIDDYLSYVGGLISTVLLIFFILSSYSALSFCLEVASTIFQISPDKKVPVHSFNFIYFILVGVKDLLEYFYGGIKWIWIDELRRCRNQAQKQLDISYILSRITFLQNTASILLEKHQLTTLFLRQKPIIDEVEKSQKRHQSLRIIKKTILQASSGSIHESNQSARKLEPEAEPPEQSHCFGCDYDHFQEEGTQQLKAELQQSYKQLLNESGLRINSQILKIIDAMAHQALKQNTKASIKNQASIHNDGSAKDEASIQNLNPLILQEINGRHSNVNVKESLEFIE